MVHGTGPVVGEAISGHPGIDMVSFTGSTNAGKRVSIGAAATVKRVALELGGKSANLVLDDADFAKAAKLGIANAWINGGQTCTAWTRMLVPASRHDEIVELAVDVAAKYTVGDPTDPATRIGPMSSAIHQQRVAGYIDRGIADGATVAFGGAGPVEGLENGAYVRPTIFTNVAPDAVIAQEEIFGPVLSVIPYADEEEGVRIANASIYGLAGAVFGEPDHALAIARRMRTGQVDVNGGRFNPLAPFGGYKQSGNGRELGRFGLEEFLEVKSIHRWAGIVANDTYPAEFLSDNLQIQVNVMDAAHAAGVERLLFLGSSCIYPKLAAAADPRGRAADGRRWSPRTTHTRSRRSPASCRCQADAQAVRRAVDLRDADEPVRAGRQLRPRELSRPAGADPALPRGRGARVATRSCSGGPAPRGASSSTSTTWPRRCVHLLDDYDDPRHINVGTGTDVTIRELAEIVAEVVGFTGEIVQDTSRPDGTPRKLLDVSRLTDLGWVPRIGLREGIESTYRWFVEHRAESRL